MARTGDTAVSMENLLEVRALRKWYEIRRGPFARAVGHVQAVTDVSLSVGRQEVLGLAGESGSGKTTVGRAILRLVEPTAGSIRFDGEEVTAFDSAQLRRFRRKAQIVFQDPYASLDPTMTIGETLAEPLQVQRMVSGAKARRERVTELLNAVALPADFAARRPAELSGGQRQRVVIARALALDPTFIVADEPVSALDVSIQAQVIGLLEELKERLGLAMLFISHDLAVMAYLSDRIAVVYLGRLMELGPARDIIREPLHPYTAALVSAVPNPTGATRRGRIVLAGDVANPVNPPSGCVFRTRCAHAIASCAEVIPELRQVAPDRWRACIRDDVP